ncbi:MAG: hypothetical protein GY771_04370 [bacterium]|nr:hypothetical protein [bacterium]
MKTGRNRLPYRFGLSFWFAWLQYSVILHLVFAIFWIPGLFHREFRSRFWNRLGFKLPKAGNCVWLHGASAGEVLAARHLVKLLRKRYPDTKIVLSTFTTSGGRAAELVGADYVIKIPFDLVSAVWLTLRRIRPESFIIVEGDYWPTLLLGMYLRKVPIYLINGRMTSRSSRSYRIFRWLYRPLVGNIKRAGAINEEVKANLSTVGLHADRIKVTRNIKYDNLIREPAGELIERIYTALGISSSTELFIAASTHSGEAETVLGAYKQLRDRVPKVRLLIAPRYIEAAGDVKAAAGMFGFKVIRRSALASGGTDYDVVILDTIGELADVYSASEVTFVGGSLTRRGGQNLLEPAYAGNVVLYGPHTENFAFETKLLEGNGGITVSDGDMLARALIELYENDGLRKNLSVSAENAVEGLLGGTEESLDFFGTLIPESNEG